MSFPSLSQPVARLPVVAGFARVPIASRWQSSAWRLAWVAQAGSPDGEWPAGLLEQARSEAAIEVHRDEGEGYWLNLTAGEPSIFVMWRTEDDEPPRALAASLSYHEAGRWLDAGETVERVPMSADMLAWLTDWVNRSYEPQQRRRQRGPKPSFMARDEFARYAAHANDTVAARTAAAQGGSDEAATPSGGAQAGQGAG